MSRSLNDSNGSANNKFAEDTLHQYNGSNHEENREGGSRERRPGGYGGFYQDNLSIRQNGGSQNATEDQESNVDHDNSLGRPRFNRRKISTENSSRSRERDGLYTNDLAGDGTGPGGRQIEVVLKQINENWDVMTRDDFLPVHVALQLMDHSSLGRGSDYQDFQQTNRQLQKALKTIVNEHHQGFNSSIGTFHKIQSSIQVSQNRVRMLKESMVAAKSSLTVTKLELKALASSSQEYEDMLSVLGQVENLQLVPEQLDAQISEKRFLSAVDTLQEALLMIRKTEMEDLGALNDLRVYFSNQETSLTDILIEELHDHLYLKSPYCKDRWKPLTPEVSNGLTIEQGFSALQANSSRRSIYAFLGTLDVSKPLEDDGPRDIESNNFQYIYIVIESLNKMNSLDVAIDRIEQRLPIELFAIVEKTNHEVGQRHPIRPSGWRNSTKELPEFDLDGVNRDHVLRDLLWTLYSKFEAIAEGHRVVQDVISGIVKREGSRRRDELTGSFKELWKLYQSEMRSLLHDYLTTDGNLLYKSGADRVAEANVFHRAPRDKNKKIFKFSEIDKETLDLAKEQEELDQILQASMPGLVSKSLRRSGIAHNDHAFISDAPTAGHKLLTEPNVFNISLLLPPTLSFLQRLRGIVSPESDIAFSTLTSFLDDFLINVFHPQLEETMTDLCARSLIEFEAFEQHPQWSSHATYPLFGGTVKFFSLIRAFCRLLDTIPHEQIFTQLVISQIVGYYDKCCGWYKVLVTRTRNQPVAIARLKVPAAIAESSDISEVCRQLWADGIVEQEDLLTRQIDMVISKIIEVPIEQLDLLSDEKSIESLCLLYSSLQWIVARLSQLRYVTKAPSHASHRDSSHTSRSMRWTALTSASVLPDTKSSIYLPMTPETVAAFDTTLTSFRALAVNVLITIHISIRHTILFSLLQVLSPLTTSHLLPHPSKSPSPPILALTALLLSSDDILSTHLPSPEHDFLTHGLAQLVDTYLVRNVSMIEAMNANGAEKMRLDILVLQQNLKAIEKRESVSLDRSARFFGFFLEGAEGVVRRARQAAAHSEGRRRKPSANSDDTDAKAQPSASCDDDDGPDDDEDGLGFSLEEMKVLVELCYSEGLRSEHREVAVAAKRGLSEHLLALSEVLWNA